MCSSTFVERNSVSRIGQNQSLMSLLYDDKEEYVASAKTGLLGMDRKTLKQEFAEDLTLMFTDMQTYLGK